MNPDGEDKQSKVMSAIQHVLSGDVNAYEVIYGACDGSLRSFIGRRFGRLGGDFIDEAAICTHEYVLTRLQEYDPNAGASFQTWLNWRSRGVASQVMYERYGGPSVQRKEDEHDPYMPTVAGPEEIHDARGRDRVLRRELKALAEDDRLSIAHHDLAGRTFAETAQRTDATVKKTRWGRDRGLRRLRTRLQRLGIRPVEVDSTPVPIFYGWDHTEPDDDYTASVTAVLPDGPDLLVGAAAKDMAEEKVEE
jgi:DNA-directed RNA polymerase specialized sigma24 family protein